MRVLYFGTYERDYPRNAQVISCLRGAGVDVIERHVSVWEGREHKFAAGAGTAARLAAAELRLLRRTRGRFDALIVGYPGHFDLIAARSTHLNTPIVFNPLVSLEETFVDDRGRFRPGSLAAKALHLVDRLAFQSPELVVADTAANARHFNELGARRIEVCFVGAEERMFSPGWSPHEPFTALFVGKLIPLHGVETIVEAARLAPDVRFRIVGSGQRDDALRTAPANVEHVAWINYEVLGREYAACGCALGIFGTSAKAQRVIPNKVFQALAVGAPVVTADTPAIRELLDDKSAVLVEPGNPQALANAVRRMPDESIAAAGHAAYKEHASEEILGARWRGLLESLVR